MESEIAMTAYVLVMTHRDGWQSVIDAGYGSRYQAEAHGAHLCEQLPEEYTGYEARPSDGQQPAQPGAVGC